VELLPLTLLGGLLALDGTSLGQFMISRPLVAGVLTGWMVGDPVLGLLIGGILEVYFISIFPVGGAERGPSDFSGCSHWSSSFGSGRCRSGNSSRLPSESFECPLRPDSPEDQWAPCPGSIPNGGDALQNRMGPLRGPGL